MSTVNKLSALAHLVGKTEEDVTREKDLIEKIKNQNKQKTTLLNEHQKKLQSVNDQSKKKDSEIDSLRKKVTELGQRIAEKDRALTNINARSHRIHEENSFIEKRIVAVYGNKALLDLLNHIDNPDQARLQDFEKFKQRVMGIRPHF